MGGTGSAISGGGFNTTFGDISQKFLDCENFKELQDYFKFYHGIKIDDNIEDLGFDVAKELLSGVETMVREFPELADTIVRVNLDYHMRSEIGAQFSYYTDGTPMGIAFNGDWAINYDKRLKRVNDSGYNHKNTSMYSLAIHETSHAYALFLNNKMGLPYHSIERQIVKQAHINTFPKDPNKGVVFYGSDVNSGLNRAAEKYISPYAGSHNSKGQFNFHETFAEAYGDVAANGNKAHAFSKEIVRLGREKYKDLYGSP